MQIPERMVAAALFLATGLALPVIFSLDKPPAPTADQVPFLLRQAFFELRIDLALHHVVGSAEEPETASDETAAEPSPTGIPAVAFQPDTWLTIAATMDSDASSRLLNGLAPLAGAMGRAEDGRLLLERGQHALTPGVPWACLLTDAPQPMQELTACLESMGDDLPQEALPYAKALLSPDNDAAEPGRGLLAQPPSELVAPLLAPFISAAGILSLLAILMFLVGMVLLFLAPRLIRRFRVADFGLQGFRFGASPVPTYLVFIIWFTLMLTIHMLVAAGAEQLGFDPQNNRVAVTVTAYVLYALAGILLILQMGQPQVHPLTRAIDLQVQDFTKKALLFGAAAYCVALPVVLALTNISSILFGTGPEANPAIPQLLAAQTPAERWALVLNVCLIAPVFEEIFFRGFLFQQLKRFFSVTNAAALSAVIFASVHLSIESFIPLFGLGLLMALTYHWVQSLWASICLHVLWNSATVAVVLLLFT